MTAIHASFNDLLEEYKSVWNKLCEKGLYHTLPEDKGEALWRLLEYADPKMIGYVFNQLSKSVIGQDTKVVLCAAMYIAANASSLFGSITKEDFLRYAGLAWDASNGKLKI